MGRWPKIGPVVPPVISPWYFPPYSVANSSTGANSQAVMENTNQAWFYPIFLHEPWVATTLWWVNGTAVSGNIDIGIYTDGGVRLVSTGSTAQGTASAVTSVDITDTQIPEGLIYMAIAQDNTTGTVLTPHALGVIYGPIGQCYRQLSAFPLPASATYATGSGVAGTYVRRFGALKYPRTII